MMGVIRYDVTESDPDEAVKTTGGFASPKPGQYLFKVLEVNPKGSGGDPDKPMIEVIFEVVEAEKEENSEFVGSRLWYYLLLPGHPSFGGFTTQKLDQFLLATGVAGAKKKRKGSFDPADIEGMEVGGVVRAGKNLDGDYRGEVASVFASEGGAFNGRAAAEDEDLKELDEIEGEVEDEEEEEEGYDDWSLKELRTELEGRELSTSGKKADLVTRLEEDDLTYEDEDEDEEDEGEEEDEEEVEEEDEDEEEEEEPPTRSRRKSTAKKGKGDFPFE